LDRVPNPSAPQSGAGLFVAFEGGEGSGKSTQVGLLAATLRAAGREVITTHEPGATPVGVQIRDLLLHHAQPLAARAEALLFAADRAHHVETVIRPALTSGAVVITDRYVDSSLAYQGLGRGLPLEEVGHLSTWATGGLLPHLTVLLDVPASIGLARAGGRSAADKLERESLDFHERVRAAYLEQAASDPARYLVLDATAAPEQIAKIIAEALR